MSKGNEREKLINKFIIKLFKSKAAGTTKATALLMLKRFVRESNKKWTLSLELLFDNTWDRPIPANILAKFKKDDSSGKIVRIKPNKKASPFIIVDDSEIKQPKIKPNKRPYYKDTPRFDEPEDIDDPKWEEELIEFVVKNPNVKCAECGDQFTRTKDYRNRLLCPKCNEKLQNTFNDSNDNYLYASSHDMDRRVNKNTALNIRPL